MIKDFFIITIVIFWLIAFSKKIIFWTYLWQLKEYHLDRFKSHFLTFNGRKIIFNYLNLIKFILILFPLILFALLLKPSSNIFFFYILTLFFLFMGESFAFIKKLIRRQISTPKITFKTITILLLSVLFLFFIIYTSFYLNAGSHFFYYLLVADFFAPAIISISVFLAHLITIVWRQDLIQKATNKRKKFGRLLVVGITGSYGKSSTKEFLASILKNHFRVLKTKANQNSEVGISKCILNDLVQQHEVFICEMGAYSKGGIKLLSKIVQPKIGVLTGINEQHLSTFGSQQNIIEGKYELIESLPKEGIAVFNGNNIYCQNLYEKTTNISEKIAFSKIPKNITTFKYWMWRDIWAEDIKTGKDYLNFKICQKDEKIKVDTRLIGKHNVVNLLMSAIVAKRLGLSLEEIAKEIEKISPEFSAIKIRKSYGGLSVIDSSYSANPDGVISDLEYLTSWKGKKIIIMPCLIELGKTAKEIHYKIGGGIADVCDVAIITTKEYFKEIKNGAKSKNKDFNIFYSRNPKKIKEIFGNLNFLNDVILLEGRSNENIKKMIYKI